MLLPFGRVCKIILARRVSSAYTSCWQFCVQPCTKHSAKKKRTKKRDLFWFGAFYVYLLAFVCIWRLRFVFLASSVPNQSVSSEAGVSFSRYYIIDLCSFRLLDVCLVSACLQVWLVLVRAWNEGEMYPQILSGTYAVCSLKEKRCWVLLVLILRGLCSEPGWEELFWTKHLQVNMLY